MGIPNNLQVAGFVPAGFRLLSTGKASTELDIRGQSEQSTLKRVARNLHRSGWERLKGTRNEAQTISQLVPASNRLEVYDFDANYNWANNPQLQQYRYLHFATGSVCIFNNSVCICSGALSADGGRLLVILCATIVSKD